MRRPGIALAGWLVAVALLRLRFLDLPLTRDEGDYAYMAQLWLAGVPPYSAAYDMRMPGIFAFYALILSAFGQSAWGIHLGLLVVHLATVCIVFELGRRLVDPRAGLVAAVAFAALASNPWAHGAVANTEHFLMLPALGGLLLLLRGVEASRPVLTGAAGLLMGLAVLTKQNAAALAAFAALLVAWRARRQLAAFLIGLVLPVAAAGALLAVAGSFGSFWFWTMTYPRQYLTSLSLDVAWGNLGILHWVIGWTFGFWLLAAVGAWVLFRRRRAGLAPVFLLGLLISSWVSLSVGLYFRPQHFQILFPSIALFAGAGASAMADRVQARRGRVAGRVTVASLVSLSLAIFLVGERNFLFQADAHRASRMVFGVNPFPESREIARYLSEHSQEGDLVAIFGSEPQIYFYARRRSATPFILVYEAMQPHAYARSMQEEMIEALEQARPRHLVFVNLATSWLAHASSERLLIDWFARKTSRDYRQVGQVDILPGRSQFRWGERVGGLRPRSPQWISVWERKDVRDPGPGEAPPERSGSSGPPG